MKKTIVLLAAFGLAACVPPKIQPKGSLGRTGIVETTQTGAARSVTVTIK